MPRAAKKLTFDQADRDLSEAALEALEISVKFLVTDFTVEFLVEKFSQEEYYVPEYQRRFIWSQQAQSRFIESVLIGLPIPFLFLWQADDGRLEIVDGSQRLRTLKAFMRDGLRLKKLELLGAFEGYSFGDLARSRQRKFGARVIRGVVLDNAVGAATRTEMFNRINTSGTKANEAEVRRGALPGPMSDLVQQCAENDEFVRMTPLPKLAVAEREREELVVRFFTYLESAALVDGSVVFDGWKDRPREYIYDFVKSANARGSDNPAMIEGLRDEFVRMLGFVDRNFRTGFRKSLTATQVPRVRFEAIAVGVGLALRQRPELALANVDVSGWVNEDEFKEITTSDAANVRSKLQGRTGFVLKKLVEV